MGSLNAPGISIVSKTNTSLRNQGGAFTVTAIRNPQTGPTSLKTTTQGLPQGFNRSVAEFGTQPDSIVSQYSTLCINPAKKVTRSNDQSLSDGLVSRVTTKVVIDGNNQPEVALKLITQRSTYNTGGRVVIRESTTDGLISRQSNQGFTPGP